MIIQQILRVRRNVYPETTYGMESSLMAFHSLRTQARLHNVNSISETTRLGDSSHYADVRQETCYEQFCDASLAKKSVQHGLLER